LQRLKSSLADVRAMDAEMGGDGVAVTNIPGRGKKRSPESPPGDKGDEDSPTSTTGEDDGWKVSDSEEEDDQGVASP
jgi:hypothetical protein